MIAREIERLRLENEQFQIQLQRKEFDIKTNERLLLNLAETVEAE